MSVFCDEFMNVIFLRVVLIFVRQLTKFFEVFLSILAKGSVGHTYGLRHLDMCLGDSKN